MQLERLIRIAVLVGSLGYAGVSQATEEQQGPWTLTLDDSTQLVSMSYPTPPTSKANIQLLQVQVTGTDMPTGGHIKFTDGTERDMSKEESSFYYRLLDGPNAAWDFLYGKKRVTQYSPADKALPSTVAGKLVRVVLPNGHNYFGKLAFDADKPKGFALSIEGSKTPIWFDNKAVAFVQALR